jgi:predicted PurR-regulated permease PerM
MANRPAGAGEAATGLVERRVELADWSMIGLFALTMVAVLRLTSEMLAPMIAAMIVGTLVSRMVDRLARVGLPPSVSAFGLVALTGVVIFFFVDSLLDPLTAFIAQAPAMFETLRAALTPMVKPVLTAQQAVSNVIGAPSGGSTMWDNLLSAASSIFGGAPKALGEFGIFFVTLAFFVAGRQSLRRRMIMIWTLREQRFTTLRVINAIEESLALYFGATAMIYAGVGLATALIAWSFGLPRPVLWGVFTFVASFIPYLGPGLVALALAAGGLSANRQFGFALAPAAGFALVHLVSENVIIPTLLGHRLEINPFVVFISIVFWSWMWGPVGAILAVPILLILDTIRQEYRTPEPTLP